MPVRRQKKNPKVAAAARITINRPARISTGTKIVNTKVPRAAIPVAASKWIAIDHLQNERFSEATQFAWGNKIKGIFLFSWYIRDKHHSSSSSHRHDKEKSSSDKHKSSHSDKDKDKDKDKHKSSSSSSKHHSSSSSGK